MRKGFFRAAALAAFAAVVAVPSATTAVGTDSTALRNAVTLAAIKAHNAEFQTFANASTAEFGHPTRVDGSVGFTSSVDYVAAQMRSYGYDVTVQEFMFDRFEETADPVFARTAPGPKTYVEETDFATMEYSGSGVVTAQVVPTNDIVLPSPGGSTSGCEASDFPADVAGRIALIQRGTCTFRVKAENAQAAGAIGVIIFNEGDTEERSGVLFGTLDPPQMTLPVIGTSTAVGQELLAAGTSVRIAIQAIVIPTKSANVIADTRTGRTDRTVVVGAHLDSVTEGSGINDNGSGSATILEVAKQLSVLGVKPVNRVRFAWWGGEEFGLLGAEHYLAELPAKQLKDLALNLNFDMVGSPNFVRFVYDGDGSATGTKGPAGSGNIEKVFLDYFASQGLATEPTAFDGRSDYGPFIDRGIPAGGLFTGAEEIKTAAQQAIFGGTAGVALDPCYHAACDTYPTNLSDTALDQMSDATADAVLQFAMTSSAVGGTGKSSSSKEASTELKGSSLRK